MTTDTDTDQAVYRELKGLARRALRGERHRDSLRPTGLVHEAWLRMEREGSHPEDRARFFAQAARAMRRILIERARHRGALKRKAGAAGPLQDDPEAPERSDLLLALDEALDKLHEVDEELVRVVEIRGLAGLSVEEAAEALGMSERTLKRRWQLARAWLHREITRGDTR